MRNRSPGAPRATLAPEVATSVPVIDGEALRLLCLAGTTNADIAVKHGVSERTVRRQIARERAIHGDRWPLSGRPRTDASDRPRRARAGAAPPTKPSARSRASAPPEPVVPGPSASADELEDYAATVLVAEALEGERSEARISAARALVELAEKRRARRPANADDDAVDPAEAAAALMREIERATDNVVPVAANSGAA